MAEWMDGMMEMLNGRGLLLTAVIALCCTAVLMAFRARLPFTLKRERRVEPTAAPQPLARARAEYDRQSIAETAPDAAARAAADPGPARATCPPELSRRIDNLEAKLKARSASQIG